MYSVKILPASLTFLKLLLENVQVDLEFSLEALAKEWGWVCTWEKPFLAPGYS